MIDDARLAALWSLDEPPARDPAFVLATLDRLARRRFRADITRLLPLFVAVAAACWAIAPAVEALFASSGVELAIAGGFGLALASAYACRERQPELI